MHAHTRSARLWWRLCQDPSCASVKGPVQDVSCRLADSEAWHTVSVTVGALAHATIVDQLTASGSELAAPGRQSAHL
jgi:hypothetical protein